LPAQSDLGLLLAERGDRARAIEHLTLAVKLQPNESRHHLKLGAVLAGAGQSSRGINHLLCAVALDSKDKLARRTLAGALMRLDRFAEAAEQYDAAVRLDAQDHESIVRRADALNRSGLVDEARQLLDELMRRRPFWPDAMDMRARIEAEHGDPAEAKRLAALACNQTNYQRARFVHTLALAYAAAGEVDAARQLAAQALAVAQAHDQSRTARQIRELLDDLASRGE
jgi:tetratricopeptide (TPR) repeat protein